MTNGFIGTIGFIKGLLMSSSQTGQLINNDNFYPGSPDIPDTEHLYKYWPIKLTKSESIKYEDKYNRWYFYTGGIMEFSGFPNLANMSNWEIGFEIRLDKNSNDDIFRLQGNTSTNTILRTGSLKSNNVVSSRLIYSDNSVVTIFNKSVARNSKISYICRYTSNDSICYTKFGSNENSVKVTKQIKAHSSPKLVFGNSYGTAIEYLYKDTLYCKTW